MDQLHLSRGAEVNATAEQHTHLVQRLLKLDLYIFIVDVVKLGGDVQVLARDAGRSNCVADELLVAIERRVVCGTIADLAHLQHIHAP